jgi:hypothetical protein
VIVNFELVTDKLRLHARGEMRAGKKHESETEKKRAGWGKNAEKYS